MNTKGILKNEAFPKLQFLEMAQIIEKIGGIR